MDGITKRYNKIIDDLEIMYANNEITRLEYEKEKQEVEEHFWAESVIFTLPWTNHERLHDTPE